MIAPRRVPVPLLALGAVVLAATVGLLATPYYFLALAVGPALLFVALVFRHPWAAVLLIIFFVPFDQFRGGDGPMQYLTISKLSGVLAIAVAGLHFALGRVQGRHLICNLWPWLLPFMAVGAVSAAFSAFPETAAETMRQLVTGLLVTVLALIFLRDERAQDRLVDTVIVSVGIGALLSVVGFAFDIEALTMGGDGDELKRGTGVSNDPNVFALLVIFSLPFVALRMATASRPAPRAAYAALFALDVFSVILTFSRGGALVLVATLLLLAYEYRRIFTIRRLGFTMFAFAGAVAVLAVATPASFWDRQLSLAEGTEDMSIGRRTAYLRIGAGAFLEAPVLGHGPGTFEDIYGKDPLALVLNTKADKTLRRAAHNTYLEVLVGTGLIGLGFFLGYLLQTFRNLSEAARTFAGCGQDRLAALARHNRIAMIGMGLYLMILTAITIKYLWVIGAVSVVLVELARARARAPAKAAGPVAENGAKTIGVPAR